LIGVQNNDNITIASISTTATQSSPAGAYPITGNLSDPNNRLGNYQVNYTGTLTVYNPPPVLINLAPNVSTINEGSTITLSGTVTDQVVGGTFTATINWG